MVLERRYLLNREVQAVDSATRTIELAEQGLVSALLLRLECTNGATAGEERIIDAVDRVEVIADGSDVLFSLEGVELYKWQYAWLRRRPPQILTQRAAAVQEVALWVPFGRFLGDRELYLDLARFNRVELRVQHSPTIAATSFATGTFTISAIEYGWRAGVFAGGGRGFLRTRQIRSFTSVAAGEELVELDKRHPFLAAMVYAREANVADGTDITTVELREEDGRVIPWTARWLDAQMENQEMLALDPTEEGVALQTDAGTIDTLVSRIVDAEVHVEDDTPAEDDAHPYGKIASINADRITLSVVEEDFTAAAPTSALSATRYPVHWRARGIGIGNAVLVPLAMPGDIDNPYNLEGKGRVELALTQGGAGAAVRVSTQELVAA